MRSKLGKAVRARFEAELNKTLPQFAVMTDERIPPGGKLFHWKIRADFHALILLQMGRRDEFTIEGAWSRNGRFPFDNLPSFPVDLPELGIRRDEPTDNGLRFRLVTLSDPRQDHFWMLNPRPSPDESLTRLELVSRGIEVDPPIESVLEEVPPAVDDAIRQIEMRAVPYWLATADGFQRIAPE